MSHLPTQLAINMQQSFREHSRPSTTERDKLRTKEKGKLLVSSFPWVDKNVPAPSAWELGEHLILDGVTME